jgi:hypothetical protein
MTLEKLKSLELVYRKNLEMQARGALQCCEKSLMDNSCGISEDRNADSKDWVQRFK